MHYKCCDYKYKSSEFKTQITAACKKKNVANFYSGGTSMADKYFYILRGDELPVSYVEDAQQSYKGTTMDNDAVYHTVFYDARRRKHIS
jgi:hypothetical protein